MHTAYSILVLTNTYSTSKELWLLETWLVGAWLHAADVIKCEE